ncbi:MAG TPA: pilus assembly protein N-terminal domain-containing protein, partial [Bryobacteraceae bacterium]|nr:pilus assembly protein N-terminal domain-containing protein [Bryobacteraceae bacterium]
MTRTLFSSMRFAAVMAFAMVPLAAQVEELRLTVGRSVVLDYPSDIRQISTSDPAVVDAIAVSTREVLLHAKGNGAATVVVWSKGGQRTLYSIVVEQNLEPLRRLVRDTFPNEEIHVQSSRDSLSLTGHVSTKEIAERAVALVTPFAKSIVNNLEVAPPPQDRQIMLRVRFAELNRTAVEQFGVNILSTGGGNTIGLVTTGQFAPPGIGGGAEISGSIPGGLAGSKGAFRVSDLLNIFAFRPDLNMAALIKALEQQQVLQILAEPNLVTSNGREASFLVGGEFPLPVLQGGGNAGAVTIQFREFGIRLSFRPELTPSNTIKMYVKPEVSSIDLTNAIQISGFLIPALSSRRIESNIELQEGQSFVIGGLLDERTTSNLQKVPGLSSVPLLGLIFKSREQRKTKSELIVMVTPEIARPLGPSESKPELEFPREFLDQQKFDRNGGSEP